MRICILTIFPEIFTSFLSTSLIGKALANEKIYIKLLNIRDFAAAPHYQVDDIPYGGGAGMVMKPEPLSLAIEEAKKEFADASIVMFSAAGKSLKQGMLLEFSKIPSLILICARYEGLDQRVIDKYVDHEISVGDYVLMGGEVPSMLLIEGIARLIPGVISNEESLTEESFTLSDNQGPLVEGPQYTRPAEFEGRKVPEVLVSGDHKKISAWRKEKAIEKRAANRPDLISKK
jgi:tRNA (guanine37-N1)-methyltransferase